jgi:hypothetical protein
LHDTPSGSLAGRDIGRPGQPGSRPTDSARPGRPSERPVRPNGDQLAQHFPNRAVDPKQAQDQRRDHRDLVRAYMRHYAAGDNSDWYDDDWWLLHHVNEMYATDFDYWKKAEWPAVNEWVSVDASETVYYSYGDNVYYQDGSVYYGDKPVATEDEYAAQAEAIATSAPKTKPAESDWMPLGVFALVADGQPTGADPTMFLQLAVSKQGAISGTFQNTATDTVQEVEGMTDKQTQRAAWTAVGKSRPLMEAGIVNLTKDTTPALIHFPDGTTQQWLLVRLDEPAASPSPAP